MRILGIDPGIARTGWGILDLERGVPRCIAFECIETSGDKLMEQRLLMLHNGLRKVIKKYSPDEVVVEELFFSTNAKTALVVGQARGVVLYLAANMGLSVSEYTPLQVKLAVAGYGKAEKKQVEKMMMAALNLASAPKRDDTSDALAIALTHAFSHKMQKVRKI